MAVIRYMIWIILCMFMSAAMQGQSAEEKMIQLRRNMAVQENAAALENERVSAEHPRPVEWDLSLGTSFVFMPGTGSGMMFRAAPMMTMPLSGRWSLYGGLMTMRYQGSNPFLQETGSPQVYSSLAVFAAASYRMNDRLILHGTGVKQLVSGPVTPFPAMDNFSLGATYRIGDNITIGATIRFDQQNGYVPSPFQGGRFYPSLQNGGYLLPTTW